MHHISGFIGPYGLPAGQHDISTLFTPWKPCLGWSPSGHRQYDTLFQMPTVPNVKLSSQHALLLLSGLHFWVICSLSGRMASMNRVLEIFGKTKNIPIRVKCTVGTWTCSAVSNRSINLETEHLAPWTCEPVHPRSSPVLHGLHGTVRPRIATVNPDLLQLPRFVFSFLIYSGWIFEKS